MQVQSGAQAVTYVLVPDGGPHGTVDSLLKNSVGKSVRVIGVMSGDVSTYMRGPVIRVLEVKFANCPLCK